MQSLDQETVRDYFAQMTKPTIKKVLNVFFGKGFANFDRTKKYDILHNIRMEWLVIRLGLQV